MKTFSLTKFLSVAAFGLMLSACATAQGGMRGCMDMPCCKDKHMECCKEGKCDCCGKSGMMGGKAGAMCDMSKMGGKGDCCGDMRQGGMQPDATGGDAGHDMHHGAPGQM